MDRLYNVTIEYLGIKKQDKFPKSTLCLDKDGAFLVMDAKGETILFVAKDCKVERIAAHVIVLRGYTDKPSHITAYCVYSNVQTPGQHSPPHSPPAARGGHLYIDPPSDEGWGGVGPGR